MMNDDNEKTVMRTRRMPFRPAPTDAPEHDMNVLPIGTHLGEFEIVDLIGEGGFGIVYLAYDHSLERHVALKEYMPSGLATRTTKMAVTVRSQHNAGTFTAGLKSFINEARMLAQFDSPALVKVHRFWEGNGTAYMAMPFYEGVTLKQALHEHRILPTEPWIRLLLGDLFDAIDTIHRVHCLHRDIAPDNILLLKDGRPLLLDFGAARRVIGDLTQCLTVILKPGFAPIEQYADIANLRQGAWTDIYALAAVVYYLITSKAPPPAVARMVHDELVPAREAGKGQYSDSFLAVLDKALAVKPENRFRSIDELRRALGIMDTVPRTLPRPTVQRSARGVPTVPMAEAKPNVQPQAQSGGPPDSNSKKTRGMGKSGESTPSTPNMLSTPKRRKAAWIVLGMLLFTGVAAGVYWEANRFLRGSPEQPVIASGGKPAPDSSGTSDVPDQEPADQEPADQAVATAPAAPSAPPPTAPPAVEAPIATPAPRMTGTDNPPSDGAQSAPPAPRPPSENELWQLASRSDKASAYENYLKEYPKGRHASVAKRKLKREQPETAMTTPPGAQPSPPPQTAKPTTAPSEAAPPAAAPEPALASAEEDLWKMAMSLNETPAYETYLNKYPNGRYAPVAKDKLASVKPAEPATPPPTVAQPQAPQAAPAARNAPAAADQQASIQPVEPSALPAPKEPVPEATPEPAPEPAPEPPVATGRKSLKLDGQTLVGDFSVAPTGSVSGTGKIIWTDGTQFEGTLVRGIKQGKGRFIWTNGQRYDGDWARDLPNGKGSIVFANGNRYTGDVKDGLPHGQGTTRFKEGDVYSGAWFKGKSQGHGRYTWVNGSYWEGEFKDDKRTENGKMVFAENPSGTAAIRHRLQSISEAQNPERPAENP